MTREQVIAIFDRFPKVIDPREPPGAPTKVSGSVLMTDGTIFTGDMYAPSVHDTMQIDTRRNELAHLMKDPIAVFVDLRPVQAITSYSGALPPAATVKEADSRKDGNKPVNMRNMRT